MKPTKYIRTGDGRIVPVRPYAATSARRKIQLAVVFWIAFIIFYAIARIPIGMVIGGLSDSPINIARTMHVPDAIIFFPFNWILTFIGNHPRQGEEVARIYWILFFSIWFVILLWTLFKWVYTTVRTMLDN